jgi:hypothetical protein
MRSELVVVAAVAGKDPAQMGLAEDDDVIEAFPADRADQSLRPADITGVCSALCYVAQKR